MRIAPICIGIGHGLLLPKRRQNAETENKLRDTFEKCTRKYIFIGLLLVRSIFRALVSAALLVITIADVLALETDFIVRPGDIANASFGVGGMVVVSFTPQKAKECARLPKVGQTAIRVLIPHDGLTYAQFGFNTIELGFRSRQDAIRFIQACSRPQRPNQALQPTAPPGHVQRRKDQL